MRNPKFFKCATRASVLALFGLGKPSLSLRALRSNLFPLKSFNSLKNPFLTLKPLCSKAHGSIKNSKPFQLLIPHSKLLTVMMAMGLIVFVASSNVNHSSAAGNTCTWVGGTDTNWETAANWSGCGVTFPDATDNISFSSATTYDLTMTANKTVASISAPSAGAFNKTFNTNNYALTVNGDFTWQKSTLTTGASDITITGNLDLTAGTFNYNSSNFILSGAASTITPKADNSLGFYNLTIDKATNATATTIQTSNFNVRNILNVKKGKLDGASRTATMSADNSRYQIGPDTTGGTATIKFINTGYIDASGAIANDTIELNGVAKTLYWNGSATLKNLILTDGTLNLQSGKLTFPASADGSAGKLSCVAGKTLTMAGTAPGSMVILRSATPGSTFYLENNCGATTAAYADIKDANNTSGIITATNSIDSGNNTGFDFATTPLVVNKWISDIESTWSTATNWSLGHAPTSTENVYFGQGHNGNCNFDVVAGATVANIISADYTGTFNGGSSNITISASLEWASGTLTATSGTMTLFSLLHSGGTFNHNSGTVKFYLTWYGNVTDIPSTEIFNNLTLDSNSDFFGVNIATGDTLLVNGTLALTNGPANGGRIDLNGTLSSSSTFDIGTTEILINDPAQTVNISNGWVLPTINLQAGTLNAPSGGTMTLPSFKHSGGTFNNNSGTVALYTNNYGYPAIDVPTTETFNNLTFDSGANFFGIAIATGDTFIVNGVLTLTNGFINGGTIDLNGTLVSTSTFDGGTTQILVNDSAQVINVSDGWILPVINLQAGILNAPASGTMTLFSLLHSGGTFNHNSGTVIFYITSYGYPTIDVPATETFNNLTFKATAWYFGSNLSPGDTLIANGKLSLSGEGYISGGTITAKGDVEMESTFDGGTSAINLTGTTDQTYTISAGVMPSGTLTINKPSGKATITGTGTLKGNIALTQGQLDFAAGNAYTMTVGKTIAASAGTRLNINGTAGNLVTFDSSDGATAISMTKPDGIVIGNYVSMNRTNVSGGATWYKTANFTGTGSTGWVDSTTATNIRTISAAGGNWSDVAAWNEGAVPTNADNVIGLSGSGNIAVNIAANCTSLDLSLYAGTLSGASELVITGPASISSLVFGGTITATSTLKVNPAIGQTTLFYSNGIQWTGSIMTSTAGQGGTISLQDDLSVLYNIEQVYGTITTNNHNILTRAFVSQWNATRTLNQGSSTITCFMPEGGNAIYFNDSSNFAYDNAGGTWALSNSGAINFGTVNPVSWSNQTINISGTTTTLVGTANVGTINVAGAGNKASALTLSGDLYVSNLNITGNSTVDRILVQSSILGTARTITAANIVASNVDFQDITFAGTMTVNSATSIGDCGGNSGTNWSSIVTPAAPQTWTNAVGGNWSTASNWTSRVPLPQDDVNMARVGGYNTGATVTADMPRLGKSIDWTGATWTGTATRWTLSGVTTSFGSVTLISGMNFTYGTNYYLAGRSAYTITSAGKRFNAFYIYGPGGTYTLADDFAVDWSININAGTFNTAGHTVDAGAGFLANGANAVDITNSTIIISNSVYGWQGGNGGSLSSAGSTIAFTYADSNGHPFVGGSKTYNNITIAPGSGVLTFSGAFTFANMTMSAPGAKTVKFTKSTTYTMTGTNFLNGTAGNLVTIDSDDGATQFTLAKASGSVASNWLSLKNSAITAGATWTAFASTNVGNNSSSPGWVFPKTAVAAGGNWSAGATWSDGVVPTAADDVYLVAGSGNVTIDATSVAKSLDCTGYTNTLTHNASDLNLYGNVTFSAGMTYTAINTNSRLIWYAPGTIISNGQTIGSLGIWFTTVTLGDTLRVAGNITSSGGTFVPNNQEVIMTGASPSFVNVADFYRLTWTPPNTATATLTLTSNITVTNALTLTGYAANARPLVQTNTIGTPRTITANAVALSNTDFMDTTFAGTMTVNSATSIGDCGGNSGTNWNTGGTPIKTVAATQTFVNGGVDNLWSTVGNWSGGRVPLPQDTVVITGTAGDYTVTADMPRLGSDISFTAGHTPTFEMNQVMNDVYGNFSLANVAILTSNQYLFFRTITRTGTQTITSNGKQFGSFVFIRAAGATVSLTDAFSCGWTLSIQSAFISNGNNITVPQAQIQAGLESVDITNSLVTITAYFWEYYSGLLTSAGSTIAFTHPTIAASFSGGTATYNNITSAPGSGVLTFSDAFTFANMTMSAPGAKTVKFTKGTTYTMTGTNFLNGTAGNLVTIDTNDGTGQFTLSKANGTVIANYDNISHSAITGIAKWYMANTSVNGIGNTGWTTDATAPANPTTTALTVNGDPETSSGWTNLSGPVNVTFSGSTDADSGVLGYYTYFGTDQNADPANYQAHSGAIGDTQTFSTSTTTADDGKHFYFRVKTKDAVGNIAPATTLFDFGYDKTVPTRPTFAASDPAGYTTNNSFTLSWPAGTDPNGVNGASGIKYYEYKRAIDGGWGHTLDANQRSVSGVLAYQEGTNIFFVRTVDNAGNISSNYQQVTYYFSGSAPAKPTSLTVSPETSDSNSFSFHWNKPAVGAGDPPVKGYRYSINAAPTMDNTTYVENSADTVTIGPDAFATIQGLNTIYVLSVNQAGNYSLEDSFVASTTFNCQTPALPAPVQASVVDSSDRTLDRWMLTLQWKSGSTGSPSTTFDHYVIYRSTDGLGFSELATTTSTAYIDSQNLNNQTTYYFNIKAVDNAGKQSAQSTTVSKLPTGKYLTPPTYLNSPDISNVKSNSSNIAWLTDRSSTSIVKYGKDRNNLTASSGQMDLSTTHEVNLMGLDPSATYYFQVQSLDENRDYSPEQAYSTTYSFQTLQAPAISKVEATNITLTSADISWETTTVASSSLYYGKNSDFANKVDDISGANATKHSVKLSSLTHSTKYSFRLLATDTDGNELKSDNYNFETLPMPAVASLKATILSDKARAGAKITWTTNVPTSSIIKYLAARSLGEGGSIDNKDEKESVISKLVTEHEITIDGLKDQTDYKIVASGSDSLGNVTDATTTTVRTPNDTRPPQISNITIETSNVGLNKQDKAQAVVSWHTDEPATSRVEYGLGLSGETYEKMTNEDTSLTSQHVAIISDLDPTTPYHLKVNSKDSAGNLGASDDQTIISSEVQKSTLRILLDALTKAFSWIKI